MGARTPGPKSRRYRGRGLRSGRAAAAGGALLSVLVLGFGIALAGPAAGSAAGPAAGSADRQGSATRVGTVVARAAATPTTTVSTTPSDADQERVIAVSPFSALAPSGAQVTVSGKGFDDGKDLWVAVCAQDGVAPAALIHCVGGAIPDDNETTGWGIITSSKTSPYPGAAVAEWGDGGSFSITLVLPAAIGDAVDCVTDPCAVYTRSSDDQDRSEDVGVPVTFRAPPTTTSAKPSTSTPTTTSATTPTSTSATTSSTPTTPTTTSPTEPSISTIGVSATTVSPESMLQTTVAVGASQVVVFGGFTPGESVAVTLFSDPISLPAVTADDSGTARIDFEVPDAVTPGAHVLQAVGAESRRVGIAQFAVVAASASVTSSATSSTSASPTTSSASTPSSSVETSSETSASPTSSIAPSPTATAITTSVPPGGGSTNNLLWLWITLGVVLVVGATAGIVAMLRARREEEEEPPLLAAGGPEPPTPGWSGGAMVGPPNPPVPPYPGEPARSPGDFGLLSGQEPELLSGRGGPDAPTQMIGPPGPEAPTQYLGPPTGAGPAGPGAGPAGSGAGPAEPGGAAAEASSTQSWSPDFTGQQGDGPTEGEGPDQGPAASGPGRHHRDD